MCELLRHVLMIVCVQVHASKGSAMMLAVKMSIGVTLEGNLRNPPCTCDKVRKPKADHPAGGSVISVKKRAY